mmetsp:Transcript_5371/g.24202  ORF Transcript_5371/g.24202 Transcript_5371/m.24202 type:complete len:200 (-) Transcript_5371:236-835(-)
MPAAVSRRESRTPRDPSSGRSCHATAPASRSPCSRTRARRSTWCPPRAGPSRRSRTRAPSEPARRAGRTIPRGCTLRPARGSPSRRRTSCGTWTWVPTRRGTNSNQSNRGARHSGPCTTSACARDPTAAAEVLHRLLHRPRRCRRRLSSSRGIPRTRRRRTGRGTAADAVGPSGSIPAATASVSSGWTSPSRASHRTRA